MDFTEAAIIRLLHLVAWTTLVAGMLSTGCAGPLGGEAYPDPVDAGQLETAWHGYMQTGRQAAREHRLGEAEKAFRDAIQIARRVPDGEPKVITSLNNLATLHHVHGQSEAAARVLEEALLFARKAEEARKSRRDPSQETTPALWSVQSLHNLAAVHAVAGRTGEAERLLVHALDLVEQNRGRNHAETAARLDHLAEFYAAGRRWSAMASVVERSLTVWEQIYGADHASLAVKLDSMARLYSSGKRYDEAERLLTRALVIFKRAFGPNHPNVAACTQNLANLLFEQGRYPEAERLFRSALAIWEESQVGPAGKALCLKRLGAIQHRSGRADEADRFEERARRVSTSQAVHQAPDRPNAAANSHTGSAP